MTYNPRPTVADLLDRAFGYVNSVAYEVTARWVFYRLLQDGSLALKADYKRLLGYLSRARKGFYGPWRPWTLADDTRAAVLVERDGLYSLHLRGQGFSSGRLWLETVKQELNCPLDRWAGQSRYVEI